MPNDKFNSGLGLFFINGSDDVDDVLTGTDANELIRGFDGNDVLKGEGGDDIVKGGDGDDELSGGPGSDEVSGGAGNDLLIYVAADNEDDTDFYDGGAGIDTLRLNLNSDDFSTAEEWQLLLNDITAYSAFYPTTINGAGAATAKPFTFESLNLTVTRFENFEVYLDGQQLNILQSDPNGETLVVELGDSTTDEFVLISGDGDANVTTGSGDDTIVAGAGDDTISSGAGDDIIELGDGDDFVAAGPGDDMIIAGQGGGDDLIDGNDPGNELVFPELNTVNYSQSVTNPINVDLNPEDRSASALIGNILLDHFYEPSTPVGLATGPDIGTDVLININRAIGGSSHDTMSGIDASSGSVQSILEGFDGGDTLHGGDATGSGNVTNKLYGETGPLPYLIVGELQLTGRGDTGFDTLYGGDNSGTGDVTNLLVGGDFDLALETLGARDSISSDWLFGGDNSGSGSVTNNMYGDAEHTIVSDVTGGDELMFIGGDNLADGRVINSMVGDAAIMEEGPTSVGEPSGSPTGGADTIEGGNNFGDSGDAFVHGVDNIIVGDALEMNDESMGGIDTLTGGNQEGDNFGTILNRISGDALEMNDESIGDGDTLNGGDNNSTNGRVDNFIIGDADTMAGGTSGGVDHLYGGNAGDDTTGGAAVFNTLYGEAVFLGDSDQSVAFGATDYLSGGDKTGSGLVENIIYGDAWLVDHAEGGDDFLYGGNNFGFGAVINTLYGDAYELRNDSVGGGDELKAGTNSLTHMWGDAEIMHPNATGGADTFVFGDDWGIAEVFDFRVDDGDDGDTIKFDVTGLIDVFDPNLKHFDGVGDGNDLAIQYSGDILLVDNITWDAIVNHITFA